MLIKLRLFSLVVILVSSVGCTTTMKNQVAIPEVSDTDKLAEIEYQKAQESELDPNRLRNLPAPAIVERGREALARGDLALARLHFTVALGKDEDLIAGYLGLGETLVREGKYDGAKAVLNKTLERDEKCSQAMIMLGVLYRTLGETDKSQEILARANELEPENPLLLTELAVTYEKSGQMSEAGMYFKKTVDQLPNSSAAFNNLGFNLLLQEKYQEAIPALEMALKLAPGNTLVTNNLALAYALNNEDRKALQLFESSVGKAGAYNNLGYLFMLKENNQDAELAFARALELSPVFYVRAKENLNLLKTQGKENPSLFD